MMHAGIKGSSPFMSDALMREESRPAPAPAAKTKRTEAGFNCAAHGLRGIAALMVFSAHLLGGSAEHVYQDHSAYVQFVLRPWQFGVYGVYLFFTISGFVILPSVLRYSTGQFALRRFLRLYPLFLTLTLLFVLLNAVTNAYPDLNNWPTTLATVTFTNPFCHTETHTPNACTLTYEVDVYCHTFLAVALLAEKSNHNRGGMPSMM